MGKQYHIYRADYHMGAESEWYTAEHESQVMEIAHDLMGDDIEPPDSITQLPDDEPFTVTTEAIGYPTETKLPQEWGEACGATMIAATYA